MQKYLFKCIETINEGKKSYNDILISDNIIEKIDTTINIKSNCIEIFGDNLMLMPGVIDDQVHFREPGLTHKATIASESKAAVAGGVTSFMEMPNTVPNCLTHELLEQKYEIAKKTSFANYSFFMGSSLDNYDQIIKSNDNKKNICGVKIFMGSSTGNMLVDNPVYIEKIFENTELLVATHCEVERTILANKQNYVDQKIELQPYHHPLIRNEEACFESSFMAIQMAKKFDTRLHILHISTAEEVNLFSNFLPLAQKRITSEVCVHHLHFTADDYDKLGYLIKCNPAIKDKRHQPKLWEGLLNDQLDIIATDHAPHTWQEKQGDYNQTHAGLPLIQHSLNLMLYHMEAGKITIEKIVEKMCHAPAICFQIKNRGFIREGYFADIVLLNKNKNTIITKDNLHYNCGWSPLENMELPYTIEKTFVNGYLVYGKEQHFESQKGMRLEFNR